MFQCTEECIECKYENKNPSGISFIDECSTDKCPLNHEQIGNVDKLGGRHYDDKGWNPLGEYCFRCNHDSCDSCIKWSNRDKKLRNTIPTELKKTVIKKPKNIPENKEKETELIPEKIQNNIQENNQEKTEERNITKENIIDTNKIIKEVQEEIQNENTNNDTIKEDNSQNFENVQENPENVSETLFNDESVSENEEDIELDFGNTDTEETDEYGEYSDYTDQFNDEEDEIPQPAEYREADEDDDEDEDIDEDDEAEFTMKAQTKFLKSPMMFVEKKEIARYQIGRFGVILNAMGTSVITVKGRNDSDGFSYCNSSKFPRYIKDKIMNDTIFTDSNMKVEDGMYFNFKFFEDIDGDIVEKGNKKCETDISTASENKVHKVLKEAFDEFFDK